MSKQADKVGMYLRILLGEENVKPEQDLGKILGKVLFKGIRVDYWIPSLKLVVEVHGIQHFQPSGFGGGYTESRTKFVNQLVRDDRLVNTCKKFKVNYLQIDYDDKVSFAEIHRLVSPYMEVSND